MASSSTVVIALRFNRGIVIAADSQASDLSANVRWPVEKLAQVGTWPLVVGFSGSSGLSKAARRDIESFGWKGTTLKRVDLVRRAIDGKLAPHYKAIREKNTPDSPISAFFGQIGLWGLAACWADDGPAILEFEASGGTDTHEYFHAVGGGANTAYAVWRTIGGRQLVGLDEGRALHVALRILQTSVNVEMFGVSEPFQLYVVSPGAVRSVSDTETDALAEAVDEWRAQELGTLLKEASEE